MPNDELQHVSSVILGDDGMMKSTQPFVDEPTNPRVQALGEFDQFKELLKNPEFIKLRQRFKDECKKTERGIMLLMPENIAQLLGREQLFGELRGLLRIEAEIEDRQEELETIERDKNTTTKL